MQNVEIFFRRSVAVGGGETPLTSTVFLKFKEISYEQKGKNYARASVCGNYDRGRVGACGL